MKYNYDCVIKLFQRLEWCGYEYFFGHEKGSLDKQNSLYFRLCLLGDFSMSKASDIIIDRLLLREIAESDSDTIVRLRSNPDVYRYFVAPHRITKEEHINWYQNSYLVDRNRIEWIGYNSSNDCVGIFGVKRRQHDSSQAEVSYILDPSFYGRGYASEAVLRLIEFCKEEWNAKTVIAEIHKDNIKSIRFAERLGFVKTSSDGDFIKFCLSLEP